MIQCMDFGDMCVGGFLGSVDSLVGPITSIDVLESINL